MDEKEKRKDLYAMASSYLGQLKSKKPNMLKEHEFHITKKGATPTENTKKSMTASKVSPKEDRRSESRDDRSNSRSQSREKSAHRSVDREKSEDRKARKERESKSKERSVSRVRYIVKQVSSVINATRMSLHLTFKIWVVSMRRKSSYKHFSKTNMAMSDVTTFKEP